MLEAARKTKATALCAVALWAAAATFATAANPPQQVAAASYIKAAAYHYRKGHFAKARTMARAQIRQRQYLVGSYEILGWSEYQLGNYKKALAAFRRLSGIAPGSVDADIGRGWANFKLGSFTLAKRRFERAARGATRDQRYMVADGLGWIAFVEQRYEDAKRHFLSQSRWRRVAKYPQDRLLGLGWIALATGAMDRAEAIFKAGLGEGKTPPSVAALFAGGIHPQPDYFRFDDALGRIALIRGEYAKALEHALRGLAKTRFNRDLFFLLDAALERLADPDKAIATYRKLAKETPGIPEYHSGIAWHAYNAGRPRLAEREFLIALQMRARYAFAQYGLNKARDQMNQAVSDAWKPYLEGEYERALAAFDRHVARIGDTNPAVATGRGWSLLALGRIGEAQEAFAKALKVDPYFKLAREGAEAQKSGYRTAYLLGWDLLAKQEYDKARLQFERAGKVAPPTEKWRITEAHAWLKLSRGQLDEAELDFKAILAQRPDAYLSRKGLGFLEAKRGNLVMAMWQVDRSVREHPDQVQASYTIPAKAMLDAGRSHYALRLITFGLRAYPGDATLNYQAARGFAQLGEWTSALRHLRQAVETAPTGIDKHLDSFPLPAEHAGSIYLALAEGLYRARRNEAAARRYQQAIAEGAGPEAIRGLGFALYRLGRHREAIPVLEEAAGHESKTLKPVSEIVPIPGTDRWWPIQYNAGSTLAWAQFRLGRYSEAADQFRRVLQNHPAWIDALSGLGWSLLRLGNRDEARRRFTEAILISPGYPDAWRGMDEFREHKSD